MKKIILLVFALILSLVLWKSLQRPSSTDSISPSSAQTSQKVNPSTDHQNSNLKNSDGKTPEENHLYEVAAELAAAFAHSQLGDETIASYLSQQNRSIDSLLAAAIASRDIQYLLEALEKEPTNPLLLYHGLTFEEHPLDERLQWSESLLEQQPSNALAAALHASNLLKNGNQSEALELLLEGSSLTSWDSFFGQTISATRGLHEYSGRSPLVAKFMSTLEIPFTHEFGVYNMLGEMNEYVKSTAPDDLEAFRNLEAQLGQRMNDNEQSGTSSSARLGLALQSRSLEGLPDEADSPFEGLTVAEAKAHLAEKNAALRKLLMENNPLEPLIEGDLNPSEFPPGLTSELLEGYIDRMQLAGEINATSWLRQQLALEEGS